MPVQITIEHPGELAALVGYLLGYQPADGAIVVLGRRDNRLALGSCISVPDPQQQPLRHTASSIAGHLVRNSITQAYLLAYGPVELIAGPADLCAAVLAGSGVDVLDTLRVDQGRCYCLADEPCLPDHGVPIATSGPAAATAVYAGLVAQPDRDSLTRLYAPWTGRQRQAMSEALDRADTRLRALLYDDSAQPRMRDDAAAILHAHGTHAVDEAFTLATDGKELTDDDAAWLLMLLAYLPVRDHAWVQITATDHHHELLRSLLRRAPDDLVAPPACLLAFWALLAGHATIANIALDRARTADPDYTLGRLLTVAQQAAIPPNELHAMFTQAFADTEAEPS
jgi:hypothetical protein